MPISPIGILEAVNNVLVLTGQRMKTGEQYVVVALEQTKKIL